jgi:putative glutamine amidotransferase
VTNDSDVIDSILDICGGVILTGGVDISPLVYGEEPIKGLGKLSPQRDEFELLLFRSARALLSDLWRLSRYAAY